MTSLRERCLFLTCKCNPSAVHFAVGTMSPPPPPPPPCTDQMERGAFAAHESSHMFSSCVLLAMLVALLSCPTPSFPFLSADSGRSTVS